MSDSEPSSTTNCNGHVVKIHQQVPIKDESRRWHLSLYFLTRPELESEKIMSGKNNIALLAVLRVKTFQLKMQLKTDR